MTGYIFSAVLLLAPPLQAVFDLPLQLAFQQAVLLGCLAWALLRLRGGEACAALAGRDRYPLWAAAGLSLAALVASPLRGYLWAEWGNYAAGLLILVFSAVLSEKERAFAVRAAAAGAWLVFAAAVLQAFVFKNFVTFPPLTNLNALALYAVMMVPLALERRAWALAGAMVILVVWTQSLGAALAGLAAAGAYAASRLKGRDLRDNAWLLGVLGALGVLVIWLLQADSVAGRLAWWHSAWKMFLARPLGGFGYSAYTWVQAGFQSAGVFREHSIYAHNYYLEFLAENGLPAAAAWFWVLFSAAKKTRGLAKFSVIAALAHSFVDFGLSVPANFWLFCFLLGSGLEAPSAQENRPWPVKPVLLLAVLLETALLSLCWRGLSFERAKARALEAAAAGDPVLAEAELRPQLAGGAFRLPALEFLGRINLTARDAGAGSAFYFEAALLENRYSAFSWRALERIYAASGNTGLSEALQRRRAEVFK
ncbi:MAG: O-antigen ligase family protein [Elusimicrobia bacterium]|nr:O-antigen ligase family protein [Elusimicrobiota bacterium]